MCFSTLNPNSAYGQCESIETPWRHCRHVMPVKPIFRRKRFNWDYIENNSQLYLTSTETYSKKLKQEMCESFGCCFIQLNEGDSYKCIMPSANHIVITTKINSFHKVLSLYLFLHSYGESYLIPVWYGPNIRV